MLRSNREIGIHMYICTYIYICAQVHMNVYADVTYMNIQMSTLAHREKHIHRSLCTEKVTVWFPGTLQWAAVFAWTPCESSEPLPAEDVAARVYICRLAN